MVGQPAVRGAGRNAQLPDAGHGPYTTGPTSANVGMVVCCFTETEASYKNEENVRPAFVDQLMSCKEWDAIKSEVVTKAALAMDIVRFH